MNDLSKWCREQIEQRRELLIPLEEGAIILSNSQEQIAAFKREIAAFEAIYANQMQKG